jgi:hypothetical protein
VKSSWAANMSRGDNQFPRICFDDEHRVRVLEKESIDHTQELETESNQFATSASPWCMVVMTNEWRLILSFHSM